MRNVLTYVVFPSGTTVENTQRIWATKARLASEGKSPELPLLDIHLPPSQASEIVVVAYQGWESDAAVKRAIAWSKQHQCGLKIVNPTTWKELPLSQKVAARRSTGDEVLTKVIKASSVKSSSARNRRKTPKDWEAVV